MKKGKTVHRRLFMSACQLSVWNARLLGISVKFCRIRMPLLWEHRLQQLVKSNRKVADQSTLTGCSLPKAWMLSLIRTIKRTKVKPKWLVRSKQQSTHQRTSLLPTVWMVTLLSSKTQTEMGLVRFPLLKFFPFSLVQSNLVLSKGIWWGMWGCEHTPPNQ